MLPRLICIILSIGVYEATDDKELYGIRIFLRTAYSIHYRLEPGEKNSNFVKNTNCIEILKWAADKNYGHRAFLKLGGEQLSLLYGAIRQIGDPSIHYSQQLDAVLGKQQQ
ncbi:MAG TPA: hypothetical protein VEH06_12560 [Candidatus Bathyarchaeia archaeon]|nr:hypothetical protein [Candidatus Bathyarchaeia archaeon]